MDPTSARTEQHLVTFRLGEELYGIDIMDVQEIVRVPDVTAVPRAPCFVEGVANLRGHVLPVISTRRRFGLPDSSRDDASRVLVVDIAGRNTGLLVDGVSEVLCVTEEDVEAPPPTIRAGGAEYLEGVVKLEGGRRLVMVLSAHRLCAVEAPTRGRDELMASHSGDAGRAVEHVPEEQLVTFRLADEDYAFDVADVKEILRPPEVTRVPMAPYAIQGVIALRDRLLPILDLRPRLGLPPADVADATRVVVLDTGGLTVGALVDRVSEVLRVPRAVIEAPPAAVSSGASHIKGIARLQGGAKLVLLLDARRILDAEERRAVERVASIAPDRAPDDEEATVAAEKRTLDEEQLVTFRLGREEFGLRIMQVQEINRLTEVTRVPMAPDFVEGVVNLRGSVIPVIDLRRRFGMDSAPRSEATRVIIVDLGGTHTGLVVDAVSEVLRLDRSAIEPAPELLRSGPGADYMAGIGKLDGGRRMLVLLDLEAILSTEEQRALARLGSRG